MIIFFSKLNRDFLRKNHISKKINLESFLQIKRDLQADNEQRAFRYPSLP